MKNTISSLAKKRMKYNKNRTVLTAIAIMLTAMLLMALGTSAAGMLDFQKQYASASNNIHATFKGVSEDQLAKLENHADVESIKANEIFAVIEYEKMNGFLTFSREVKGGIYQSNGDIIKGRTAEKADEICGSEAFFKRLGAEPEVGGKVKIPYRILGKGKIKTQEFTISGIVSEAKMKMDISDSRIVYGGGVSEALVNEYIPKDSREYNVMLRVKGEIELNYDEIKKCITNIADDVGVKEEDVNLNNVYLMVMTDPGTEVIRMVAGIALLIIVFSGMVIYSIYYVGVITDVQEIGKLKALGASRKQVKRVLLREGFMVSGISVPAGLILGYLVPYFMLPVIAEKGMQNDISAVEAGSIDIKMFSLPVLLTAAAAVLITVYISLLKPMRMASRISPIDAVRYQENGGGKKRFRKKCREISVFGLGRANLVRNKKRTAVTMVTMGLSCVLFMSFAGLFNSISADDIADRELDGHDFKISIDYALDDSEYPENNLQNIQKKKPLGDDFIKEIEAIDGVEKTDTVELAIVGSDYPSVIFEDDSKITVSYFTREECEEYSEDLKKGEIDYDKMAEENGVMFTADYFSDDYNLSLGQEIPVKIFDGDQEKSLNIKIMASADISMSSYFIMPEEMFKRLDLKAETTTELYIDADDDRYDEIKEELNDIVDSDEHFVMYSRDEEIEIGKASVGLTKGAMYAILVMIAVIGFMNLINTMITSIVTRKRELGMLQAVGLSDRQMIKMLAGEGMVFTAGTLIISLSIGNLLGYFVFLWAKDSGFMSVTAYHYPVWETLLLALLLVAGQLLITLFTGRRVKRESLIDRIRSGE